MTLTEKTCVVVIKPLSIGRGDGPRILETILTNSDLVLTRFRTWRPCHNTMTALANIEGWSPTRLGQELQVLTTGRHVWVGEFGSLEPDEDAHALLTQLFGPEERTSWLHNHLRYQYSAYKTMKNGAHPTDTVVHIASKDKTELIRDLLF